MNIAIKAFLLGMVLSPMVCAAQTDGCDAKRVDGLEAALAQMNANCTDAVLRSDAQRKVVAAQKKLAERERDLQEAKANGKSAKKIADRQRKVDEAHVELENAQMDVPQ